MTQDEQKRAVAREAIKYVVDDAWIGVGSGSTANYFIDELAKLKHRIKGTVSSSVKSTERLKSRGIVVEELNNVDEIPVYIDGADEVTRHGAKIVAAVAQKFVCIVDGTKLVDVLGRFPLPVETIPMARSYVARKLAGFGGRPEWRTGFTTDNGNVILDVHGLSIVDPVEVEDRIRSIVGVVTVGLFARRGADVVLMGTESGVQTLTRAR